MLLHIDIFGWCTNILFEKVTLLLVYANTDILYVLCMTLLLDVLIVLHVLRMIVTLFAMETSMRTHVVVYCI